MMIKRWSAALFGLLFLFSCGELPEQKPRDWNSRTSFTDNRYSGVLFTVWSDVTLNTVIKAKNEGYAQGIDKSQHWKGSGNFLGSIPAYYIFQAEKNVTVKIDWRYREDDNRIDFAYKKVGIDVIDYGFSSKRIAVAQNEYLVIRISSLGGWSTTGVDWELGFIVE
jgi:hypothetical protein